MRILRALEMGQCFGVRDALRDAFELQDPQDVTIWGELVHNPVVRERLAARGFREVAETERHGIPSTQRVLITAHGVSDRERARLRAAGRELIDTTCPLVKRAHRAALQLAAEGRHVVVVGKQGHVEVEGLAGDIDSDSVAIVAGPEGVCRWPHQRLGVVAQTTTPPDHLAATVAAIRAANPTADIRVVDTVCDPTRRRQLAIEDLAARVPVAVVVGGRTSNNTRALVAALAARGVRAHQVEGPDEVEAGWFEGVDTVGLTAGTSTLDETIDAVEARIVAVAASRT